MTIPLLDQTDIKSDILTNPVPITMDIDNASMSSSVSVISDIKTHRTCFSQNFGKKCLLILTGILLVLAQVLVVMTASLQPLTAIILGLVIISISIGLFILECCWGCFNNLLDTTRKNQQQSLIKNLCMANQQLQVQQLKIQEQSILIDSLQKDIETLCREKENFTLANQEKIIHPHVSTSHSKTISQFFKKVKSSKLRNKTN